MKTPDYRDLLIAEQAKRIAELEEQLRRALQRSAELEAKLGELEAKQNQNSRNSSRPPSSDGPQVAQSSKGKKGRRRKRGAQRGHKPHRRQLVAAEQVTERIVLVPERCKRCQRALSGHDPRPRRHQVIEIPQLSCQVTEYQCHRLRCQCGHQNRAQVPKGVPEGSFGPRLCALVSVMTGKYRLSKRAVTELLSDVLGIQLCVGSICNIEQLVSCALQQPVEEACQFVKSQRVVHQDETGWPEANERAWLWTAVTATVTVFHIARSRAAHVSRTMLGSQFRGIVVSDRFSVYRWVATDHRQLCWAHLLRDFQAMIDRGGKAAMFGEALKVYAARMFRWWHRVRDGTLQRRTFERRMVHLAQMVGKVLRDASNCLALDDKTRGTCREILTLEPALWTFVHTQGVEPTNNDAERELRHAVLWRKGCFGTQSQQGSRFVERILTTVATLKRQSRHVLDYLTLALQALFLGNPAPSLLPSQV